jgi:hypothetical protein
MRPPLNLLAARLSPTQWRDQTLADSIYIYTHTHEKIKIKTRHIKETRFSPMGFLVFTVVAWWYFEILFLFLTSKVEPLSPMLEVCEA